MLLVIVNTDNKVSDIYGCSSEEDQQANFESTCLGYGIVPCEEQVLNGFIELEDNVTICMVEVFPEEVCEQCGGSGVYKDEHRHTICCPCED